MYEQSTLHILSQAHLDPHAAPGEGDHRCALKGNGRNIDHCKNPYAGQRISLNEMIDGKSLKQRKYDVDQGTEKVHDKDHDHCFFIGL